MSSFGFNPGFNLARLVQPNQTPQQPQQPAPQAPAAPPTRSPVQPQGQAGQNFGQGQQPTFNFHFGGQPDILNQIAQQAQHPAGNGQPAQPQQPAGIGGGAMPLGGGFQSVMPGAVPGTPGMGPGAAMTQAGQQNGNGLVQTAQGMMTQQEAQRRGLVGPFSTQNLLGAFQQDVRGQQAAYERQHQRQQGAEQGFLGTLGQVPQAMEQGLHQAVDPLNRFAAQLEGMGQSQHDELMQRANQMGNFQGPDLSLMRRDLDASNRASAASVSSAVQARAQYSDQSAQRASAIASSLQSQVADQMRMIQGGMNPDGSMMTPQQQQQAMTQLRGSVQTQTSQALAQYLDESQRYRTGLTQAIGAAQAQEAGQLSQNAAAWGNAQIASSQMQRESMRDAAQVASYAVQAQQRMVEAAGQVRQYVSSVVNASVINTANLMLQGWQTYSQMIDAHPEGYASITNGLLALAQVDAARNTPQQFSMVGGGFGGGLQGGWQTNNGSQGGFQPMNQGGYGGGGRTPQQPQQPQTGEAGGPAGPPAPQTRNR